MNYNPNKYLCYKKIFKLGQIVTSEVDLEKLFSIIIYEINQIMDTETCSVFLYDPETEELYSQVSTDIKKNEIRIPSDQGVTGWVFNNRKIQIITDPYNDPRFLQKFDRDTGKRTRNMLCIPLINRDDVCIGTLQVLNKARGEFSKEDKDLLVGASYYVVIALENAKLYKELKTLDKARKRVVDHLSHELLTPLSIISSALGIVKKRLEGTDYLKSLDRVFSRSFRNIERLKDLQQKTNDILVEEPFLKAHRRQLLSNLIETLVFLFEDIKNKNEDFNELADMLQERVESVIPLESVHEEKLHLKTLIEEICETSFEFIQHRNIAIIKELSDTLELFADRSVFIKVFNGLLKNAVENTPDQGEIKIEAVSANNKIKISVRDYGIGITPENQKFIFGGFFHTQETILYSSKNSYEFGAGGAGIDLLRIRALAERHHFDIDFESSRCRFLPHDSDICSGSIEKCSHINSLDECKASGGSVFTLSFSC